MWLCVDEDETENIFEELPPRDSIGKNGGYWSTYIDYDCFRDRVIVPKGTIHKLIGRTLTWQDNPVEVTEIK